MKVIIDIEANGLDPDIIWCIVCRDVETGEVYAFEQVSENPKAFLDFASSVSHWICHNIIGYDGPALRKCLGTRKPYYSTPIGRALRVLPRVDNCTDTLVISRLLNFGVSGGHSLEAWGSRFGVQKVGTDIRDWSKYDPSMLQRCLSDTEINLRLYEYQLPYLRKSEFQRALQLEHQAAADCRELHDTGFEFDLNSAIYLKDILQEKLNEIDNQLISSFSSSVVVRKEFTPQLTKAGTLAKKDFFWVPEKDGVKDLSFFKPEETYSLVSIEPFNPGSLQQIIDRLWDAGWKPTEKTKGYIEYLKDRGDDPVKLERYQRYGWKVTDENLLTLPDSAPPAAKRLVERLLLASRISDLEEWIAAAEPQEPVERFLEGARTTPTGTVRHRIHGSFTSIGAWTHRMSHSKPNMANIPKSKHSDKETDLDKLSNQINDDMRSLWVCTPGWRLIGTDADGIQMRIFAHYVNDKRLIESLIKGDKKLGTDIHSLNRKALGEPCQSRDDAKTFIYAWLLGAGIPKVAEILRCSVADARQSCVSFLEFYPGLKYLKETVIPADARRGFFYGIDNRAVICDNSHLMLAGYLQNGESVVMKLARQIWKEDFVKERIPHKFVNFVHDEWQTEVPDDDEIAKLAGMIQVNAIIKAGELLNLNCPLNGETKIGYNWKDTH